MRFLVVSLACFTLLASNAAADDLIVHFKRLKAYNKVDDHDQVISELTHIIDHHDEYKNDAAMYFIRGNSWRAKGEHDKAIQDFDKAIALDPDDADTYYYRGNSWYTKGEPDKAIRDFDKAIALSPEGADAYCNRGISWRAKGEYDKSIQDFNKAIVLNPDFAEAYNNRGISWRNKGEYGKAIRNYDKAIALSSDDAKFYGNRGYSWDAKGEYDKAIRDYDKAIALSPDDADVYNNRGFSWRAKGEYDKAIQDFNKAIALNPDFTLAYRNLAWLLATSPDAQHRDGKRAVQMGEKLIGLLESPRPDALATLAAAYAENGQFDNAVKMQQEAIKLLKSDQKKESYRTRLSLYLQKKPYREK